MSQPSADEIVDIVMNASETEVEKPTPNPAALTAAMTVVYDALQALPNKEARQRVLRAVAELYGIRS